MAESADASDFPSTPLILRDASEDTPVTRAEFRQVVCLLTQLSNSLKSKESNSNFVSGVAGNQLQEFGENNTGMELNSEVHTSNANVHSNTMGHTSGTIAKNGLSLQQQGAAKAVDNNLKAFNFGAWTSKTFTFQPGLDMIQLMIKDYEKKIDDLLHELNDLNDSIVSDMHFPRVKKDYDNVFFDVDQHCIKIMDRKIRKLERDLNDYKNGVAYQTLAKGGWFNKQSNSKGANKIAYNHDNAPPLDEPPRRSERLAQKQGNNNSTSNGSREWSISWSQQPSLGVSVSRYPTANLQHSVQTLKGSDKHPVIPVAQLHPGYTCNMNSECDQSSIVQQSPLVHQRANKEKKPYKCPECNKCFRKRRTLVIHERIHTGVRPYKCPECSKCFKQCSHLTAHKRSHTERAYKCPECSKCFRERRDLVIHERIHTGERPYKCSECSKGFTRTSSLRVHLLVHKEKKSYKCPECNKCYRHRGTLVIHERTHTGERPYKCPECSKSFTTTSNLRVHLLVHKEKKPYKCPECNKCFRQRGNLVIHERTHMVEKPYKCAECSKGFTTTSSLRLHLLVHKEKNCINVLNAISVSDKGGL
ncbi:zinc finger protein 79-like [Protopterus annectens]|uniref:zinc finger protein 79-like n=1 Tax=Protopterus annectens TaxID=7888 RepID=UPI001CF9B74E|nr:zinc finger protein 79-like [Protopterus annectens]